MKLLKTLFLLITIATVVLAQQEKFMAVTFDDMPYQHQKGRSCEEQLELIKKLIEHIEEYNVPAVGFVNEMKLYNDGVLDSSKIDILKTWLDAGLEFGNHTFSHYDIGKVPFEEYGEDILKGEKITKALAEERGIKYEYFRHPYLRSGDTQEKMLALKDFLKENNYKVAPVTIDNSEWIFAYGYNLAYNDNDQAMMEKLGKDYVDYMIEKIKYWEGQSQKLFARNIKQVLLIHANLLNVNYFDDLAEAIQNFGYKFISLDEALEDDAYQSENTYVGKYGPSWLDRWALTKGVDKSFFENEPGVPQYLKDYTGFDYE